MTDNLDIFRKEYLGANTWEQRKNGVPLDLLDNLSIDELRVAESELIKIAIFVMTGQSLGLDTSNQKKLFQH